MEQERLGVTAFVTLWCTMYWGLYCAWRAGGEVAFMLVFAILASSAVAWLHRTIG